jgi:prepilin-type processing-associated H-X9-DG protein
VLRVHCKSNLRQIGLACHMYADDWDGAFPARLEDLSPNYVDNPRIFVCRGALRGRRQGAAVPAAAPAGDYDYFPGRDASLPGEFVLAIDRDLTNHGGQGFNVLFVDAHVEWWPAERLEELRGRLDEQDRVLAAIRAEPARRDALLEAWRKAREGTSRQPVAPAR